MCRIHPYISLKTTWLCCSLLLCSVFLLFRRTHHTGSDEEVKKDSDSTLVEYSSHSVLFPTENLPKEYPMLVSEKDNLQFCRLPKNAITQFKDLFRKYHHDSFYKRSGCDFHDIAECFEKKLAAVNPDQPSPQKWAIIRDPLYRFLSGWLDKCVILGDIHPMRFQQQSHSKSMCYGCDKWDLLCFLHKHYIHLQKLRLGIYDDQEEYLPCGYIMKSPLDCHWRPQFWFCGFKDHISGYNKLIYYSKNAHFRDAVHNVFLKLGWSEEFLFSGFGGKAFLETSTRHKTNSSDKNRGIEHLKTDATATELFFRAHFIDYYVFRFRPPSWFQDICRTCEFCQKYYWICKADLLLKY